MLCFSLCPLNTRKPVLWKTNQNKHTIVHVNIIKSFEEKIVVFFSFFFFEQRNGFNEYHHPNNFEASGPLQIMIPVVFVKLMKWRSDFILNIAYTRTLFIGMILYFLVWIHSSFLIPKYETRIRMISLIYWVILIVL